MKTKTKIFLSSLLATLVVGGTVGGVFAFKDKIHEPTTIRKTITTGLELQLIPHSDWESDNAWFAAYFYNSNGNEWVKMTDEDDNGVYEVISTGEWDKVIFTRMDPTKEELSWDNKWNQTINLEFDGYNTCYDIQDHWDKENVNEGKATGTWRSLITNDELKENTKPYEATRVWFTISSQIDWWMSSNERTYVRYWDDDGSYYSKINQITSGDRTYYYTDISHDALGYQIVRVHKTYKCIYNYTENIEINSEYTGGRIVKILSEKSQGDTGNNKWEYMTAESVSVEMATLALEGIVSCSNDRLNGIDVYPNMKATFFDNMSATDYETFINSEILDYASRPDFDGYKEDITRETTYFVKDKIAYMEDRLSGSKATLNIVSNNTLIYLLVPTVSIILALVFVYFLKKRKLSK